MRNAALILTLSGLLVGGCGGESAPSPVEPLTCEQYGELPGLRGTSDQGLRDELARIVEDGGTPEQLSEVRVAAAENVAVGLANLFPSDKFPLEKLRSILADSDKIFPPPHEEFDLSPTKLQRAIRFQKRYGVERVRVRKLLERPFCEFGIRFVAGDTLSLDFIEVVRLCGRLEAFHAAEALGNNHPEEAIGSLQVMLRLAVCLGAEKHFDTRAEAAFLRTEAFRVMTAILNCKGLQRAQIDRLCEMALAQLKAWPSDAGAWIGERAMGMHAYEMIRDHRLQQWLGPERIVAMSEDENLDDLVAAVERGINDDELYYLQTMRVIIESCRRPYYERIELFESIDADLRDLQDTSDYPVVAGRFLLTGIQEGHRMLAHDRANWEAGALALALATGRPRPANVVNPLTGEEYRQDRLDGEVVVSNFGSGEGGDTPSIRVPILAEGK